MGKVTSKLNQPITSFIKQLSRVQRIDYIEIFDNFNFENVSFEAFESWSEGQYTRNCIFKNEEFELILICWDRNQETSIHNHDGEDCWVYIIEGEIEEVFYNFEDNGKLKKLRSQIVTNGTTSFINDKIGLHKLRNNSDAKTKSLHLYAKPIGKCRSYCEESGVFEEKNLTYDNELSIN